MGLHRDGEVLGLKPFETEMRRRLWWQIIMVDAKYALLSGLSHTLLPRGWDTKEPKNIKDEDLLPSATEPIQDKNGPTDMILVMICCKIAKGLMHLPGIETIILFNELEAAKGITGQDVEQLEGYRKVLTELDSEVEEIFTQFSSPDAGPLHNLARQLKFHLLGKFVLATKSQGQQADRGTEVFDHTSNTFKMAVETTSHAIEHYKLGVFPGWDWFARLHFQMDVFVYLIGQLCHRTAGPLVDRAWGVVEDVYRCHPELLEVNTQKTYHHVAHFVFKAWRKREAVLLEELGAVPEIPECVQKLRLLTGSDAGSVKSELGRMSQDDIFFFGGGSDHGAAPIGSMDFSADSAPFDAFLGNYFDFNNALDFDIWGNPPVPLSNTGPGMSQQRPLPQPPPNNMPYSQRGPGWR